MSAGAALADLQGITVLDLAGVGPAARCVRVLADLGARWIRLLPPPSAGRIQTPWYGYGALRGAEQLVFDLKAPRAAEIFLRLARQADVIVESFRPGVADRLGIGYQQVSALNPRIIFCATTGYGQTGPRAQEAGHDLNYQALAGALSTIGRRADGGPALPGLTLGDSAGGGWQAAIRILSALVARQRTGTGAYLDVAASEGVLHLMALTVDEHFATGTVPSAGNTAFTGRYACYDVYRASDGWVAVAAIERKFFANLCQALDLPSLAARQYDDDAQPELRRELAEAFAVRTRAEWTQQLTGIDCCVTPVLSVDELASEPHWQARAAFREYQHPERGTSRQVASFGSGQRGGAPGDTTLPDEILTAFGFAAAEILALKVEGVAA